MQLHTHVPELGTTLAGRPVASAVVRAQLAHGNAVTSLRHAVVDIDDDLTRRMLPLLDGTRECAAIA